LGVVIGGLAKAFALNPFNFHRRLIARTAMTLFRLIPFLVATLATISHATADGPLERTLIAPFQDTAEDNGVTTSKPLLIMPCKGATKPTHPGDGDAFLVFRNVSHVPVQLSLRDPAPVSLTFFTPNGTVVAKKWLPRKYTVRWMIRVCPINLFQIPRLVDDPLDWMAVYSTSRVLIECILHLYLDEHVLNVNSGWLPIAVHEPNTDTLGTVPQGSAVEAVPSSKTGYSGTLR
jgi:hypothetical protein